MNIGYIWQQPAVDFTQTGAPQLHMRGVIHGLQKLGHTVRIITYYQGTPHYSDDFRHWHPIAVNYTHPLKRPIQSIQGRLKLPYFNYFTNQAFAQAILAAMPSADLFYERFHLMHYGAMFACRQLKVPLVYEVNGDIVAEQKEFNIKTNRGQWPITKKLTKYAFKQATKIIAVGETIRQRTIESWAVDPHKVVVVPNGTDVELFVNSDQTLPPQLQAYDFSPPTIVFVGGFQPWHGVDLITRAFHELSQHHPTAQLLLVGDGPQITNIEQMVAKHNLQQRVIFAGRINHRYLPAILQAVDIAVIYHPSSAANLVESPLKIYEYMAAGKAVVAPDFPHMQKIIDHQQTGILAPPDNPTALAACWQKLLDNPDLINRLGQAAQKQAITHHSWLATARKVNTHLLTLTTTS
ncbi:MAG TPA: glycosyltransferase family 4 protein [Anaerolineae bacterium]|nr:glycosyltransferase family 4 protein [Anaerolineae bacterium]